MVIPFILSPALCYTSAYCLTKAGFLPEVATSVIWTTPPLLSGFIATGSVRGIIVQLINILISVACYSPFVRLYERHSLDEFGATMDELVEILKKCEETSEEVTLTECEGNAGRLAKLLVTDLQYSLYSSSVDASSDDAENPLVIKYQPQFDNKGKCIGAEALLRWEHARYGSLYPPLVIRLAKESGICTSWRHISLRKLFRTQRAFARRSVRISSSV
jgi:Phosphotransferase system cellobiose-specific component IIC